MAGGWGVDLLIDAETRSHRDLDLAIDASDHERCMSTLDVLGYVVETDWLPLRVEVVAVNERWVDVHPVTFDSNGLGVQGAIASGSWTTAAARMKDRVGAASVRTDMPAVIAQMHDDLTAESVEAWFATIPDEVLVARAKQIQRSDTYDPDVMLRNVAVLESFRDDALAFIRDEHPSTK